MIKIFFVLLTLFIVNAKAFNLSDITDAMGSTVGFVNYEEVLKIKPIHSYSSIFYYKGPI